MSNLVLAPYLTAPAANAIGDWDVLAFSELSDSELVPDGIRHPVERLVEAYRQDGSVGVIFAPNGDQVGSHFERSDLRRLDRALLAGVIGGNQPLVGEEDESPNSGWTATTSENALLYAHPLGDGDSYALQIGMLVQTTSMRRASGDKPLPKIQPPVELHVPMTAFMDTELADAVYAVLGSDNKLARQLHRALDWYRIAFSNSEAVTLDMRVSVARAAIEALTAAGDKTKQVVRAYGQLVSDENTPEATYSDVFWAKGDAQLTPDEWWMTRLCELRNKIMHGDEVPKDLWSHEGHHQIDHIHDALLKALRARVAISVDDPLLRIPRPERTSRRAYQRLEEAEYGSA